jgi:hypothetical protein
MGYGRSAAPKDINNPKFCASETALVALKMYLAASNILNKKNYREY